LLGCEDWEKKKVQLAKGDGVNGKEMGVAGGGNSGSDPGQYCIQGCLGRRPQNHREMGIFVWTGKGKRRRGWTTGGFEVKEVILVLDKKKVSGSSRKRKTNGEQHPDMELTEERG